tara:strand:+ start:1662 stop:1775 length:114 start_codon:yes stop_codon:yes gene_type:complete
VFKPNKKEILKLVLGILTVGGFIIALSLLLNYLQGTL